jgi:hypothetical protein
MADPTGWRDLRSAFNQLAFKYGDRLRPGWTSTPRNDAGEHWYVLSPTSDDANRERNRFVLLAKRAGVYLSGGGQVNPEFVWLDHLRMKSANFIGVHCEGNVGEFECGTIEHPCQASAECCFDLETEAMARAKPPEALATRGDGSVHDVSGLERLIREGGPGSSGTADLLSLSDGLDLAGKPATESSTERRIARANTVAKLIKELNVLRPQMFEDESEYERLRAEYPGFLVFKIAEQSPNLKTKVLAIQGSIRHILLAQEFAAALHGRKVSTIQKDWKNFKPPEFRRPK